jgi:hypothetical protein
MLSSRAFFNASVMTAPISRGGCCEPGGKFGSSTSPSSGSFDVFAPSLSPGADSSLKLHRLVQRLFQLARSLPPEPLAEFEAKTRNLPRATEAERLVVMRLGQDVFRGSLLQYWNGRCPLTGIEEPELLRASHIVPWAECESDAERLDVHNGLLLSALWDAAFDKGLVSFADDGTPLASPKLSTAARAALDFDSAPRLVGLWDAHLVRLSRHRATNRFPS